MIMDKVVCPECGANLTMESLCQYGLRQKISSNGRICKRIKKVDSGPMDEIIVFCPKCKRCLDEDEYTFYGGSIRLNEGVDE